MYLEIDLHKRYAQVAVMDQAGTIVEEVRVENANLDDLAQRYAGTQAVLEATSNYYHIHDTLSDHLDVTVAHSKKNNQIADTDKKTNRVDAKELPRMLQLNSVPESYVPTEEVRNSREQRSQPSKRLLSAVDGRNIVFDYEALARRCRASAQLISTVP